MLLAKHYAVALTEDNRKPPAGHHTRRKCGSSPFVCLSVGVNNEDDGVKNGSDDESYPSLHRLSSVGSTFVSDSHGGKKTQ